ncbi:MAG: ABC transporter ATP-binding protein [Staphylococcus simulans]|uniref:ABC transporter ATP-binding protein n=1 Tax=Staphylococcus simulans TaxID=1286 RepID=UPI0025529198|nr:ABC transporter ATP-binding protein [Staphylococcus simulans]MDK7927323.1 ABC transporter ATP-binding protein [Staphylococcus simulans]MDK8316011.1 ABC transporter ATP-binding protein [Staphylococcus simulans]
MLLAQNLRLKYPNAPDKIFDGLDVEIPDKQKVLLLGPSGCGKSTLLNVLSGIVPNLIELPMKYDALEVDLNSGVIFQDPDTQFCMPKVYEELAFVLENKQVPRKEMDALIQQALASVDLDVGPKQTVQQLSGGMKQKLAIAETVLQEADTLFLDEPTAMLDVDATEDLWNQIKDMWQEQTVLIVEHKVEHIWEHVDRVILMNHQGEIIADDTPQVILHQHEDLLTEYGGWHPKAWDHAPKAELLPNKDITSRFKYENGEVIRGKKTLIQVPELTIGDGEWITITGKNGAGKTTLLESMMQLIKYRGEMSYDGQPLHKIKEAAKHMYLVYQNPELQFITNSVYEEIFINFSGESAKAETEKLIELLNLEAVRDQHPFELSMGQKRRLSVATALSSRADIILLDEPTFGLDSHNTFNLLNLFQQRVAQGQTIIMVTHDPHIIERYPTRRIELRDHMLCEDVLFEMEGETNV